MTAGRAARKFSIGPNDCPPAIGRACGSANRAAAACIPSRDRQREGGGLHAAPSAAMIAAITRSGLIGRASTRAPIPASASFTALAMAAGGPIAPPSPMPFCPNLV